MQENDVIVVTGAAGFIGSYLTGYLNSLGFNRLIVVDDFGKEQKQPNLHGKKFLQKIDREAFFDWQKANKGVVKYIFHLGARTDTTEMDYAIHKKWNLDYSKAIWEICVDDEVPLVYASSAATYGAGEHGYSDAANIESQLRPLNPYGISKNEFDLWALAQDSAPPFWAGLKFFNVYGPNEYHKGRMASVILHAFDQIQKSGSVNLFRSHNPDYRDGEQIRDFIYVKDVARICIWLMQRQPASGLYNTGTGTARTFKDLVRAIFSTIGLPENISYIDTPIDIRDKYQYFTEADMHKLTAAGYPYPFHSLEEGINEYINDYLSVRAYY